MYHINKEITGNGENITLQNTAKHYFKKFDTCDIIIDKCEVKIMKQYLDLCRTVLEKGSLKEDRTGTGTISYFGCQVRYDLSEGFPLLTTKKVFMKAVLAE